MNINRCINVDFPINNMATKNLVALIYQKTGVVIGTKVYIDITKLFLDGHPVKNVKIDGFQVSFWKENFEMLTKAALKYPQN